MTKHPSMAKARFHAALGGEIRRHREALGMSQRAVAIELGISQSTLDKYEDGTTAPPSFMVWQLAHLFDVSIDALMVDPEDDGEEAA